MSLKVFEGFDHYLNNGDLLTRSGFLQWTGAGAPILAGIASPGRFGVGKCMAASDSVTGLFGSFASTFSIGFLGFAVVLVTGAPFFDLFDTIGGTTQVRVVFNEASASLSLFRGASATLLATSANNVYPVGTYFYFEIGATISNAGSVELRVNGNTVLTFSGDTQQTANAWFNAVSWRGPWNWDDFYFNDNTVGPGTFPMDSFVGDCRVETLFATANSSVSWTPLALTNWQEISETGFDGDTTYNSSSTIGQLDEFVMQDLTPSTTSFFVLGVQVTGGYRKDDAGLRQIEQHVNSGGTDVAGSSWTLSGGYTYFTDLWVLDPNTGLSWTQAAVNAAIAGYKLIA